MKNCIGLICLSILFVRSYAQDTLRSVDLREVEIVHPFDRPNNFAQQPDSLLWRREQSADIGRLLNAAGLTHTMSYGPTGTAALMRIHGTAPDHTNLLWNGISLQSVSLGMADFSMVPASFFDGVSVQSISRQEGAIQSGFGGDVSLLHTANQQVGWSIAASSEMNSMHNQFYSAKVLFRKRGWYSDTRIVHQFLRNDFSYNDTYRIDHPEIIQTRNDGTSSGVMQRVHYARKQNQWKAEGWYLKRDMQIPASMGSYNARLKDQFDEQFRGMVSHQFTSSAGDLQWHNSAAWLRDSQIYSDRTQSAGTSIFSSTEGQQIQLVTRVIQRFNAHWQGDLSAQFQQLEVRYDNLRRKSVMAPVALMRLKRSGTLHAVTAELREEWRTNRAPVFSGRLMWNGTLSGWKGFLSEFELARKVRIPDFNELYWTPGGNPNLRCEESIGVKGAVSFGEKESTHSLRIEGYYNQITDWIQWIPGTDGVWSPQNFKEVHTTGVESSWRQSYKWRGVQWIHSTRYEWNRTRGFNREERNPAQSFVMVYSPEHRLRSALDAVAGNWTFSFAWRFQSMRFTDEANDLRMALDPFHVCDVSVYRQIKMNSWSGDLGIRADNLLNHQYELVRTYAIPGRVIHAVLSIYFKNK